jgi:hypothetical protein
MSCSRKLLRLCPQALCSSSIMDAGRFSKVSLAMGDGCVEVFLEQLYMFGVFNNNSRLMFG